MINYNLWGTFSSMKPKVKLSYKIMHMDSLNYKKSSMNTIYISQNSMTC